jgi:rod shape-determining protein MreC
MNKELLPALVIIFALFGGALYYFESVQRPFLSLLSHIKLGYHNSVDAVDQAFYVHFDQQYKIEELQARLERYEKDKLVMQQLRSEHAGIVAANNEKLALNPDVDLVRVISYARFGDHRKLWLDMDEFDTGKVYGLVYDGAAAGIVVNANNQPMALLNGDPKSTYAVFVGDKLAPGIVHGNNADELVVKFIPTWIPIKPGDEVITSGLDNLFFHGLKVGKVLSVSLSQGYQNALIEPYYKAMQPDYFHVIRQLR